MQNIFDPLIKIYKALYLFAYDITGSHGLALILLSIFTFVVLYPFNKKAQEIQIKEHKIQSILSPQIGEIKKQYSGREQYEQLQWLYHRYGYHPLYAIRSALGLILQIPFLSAAYYMLSNLAEIQGVSWGFIPNLGAQDHLLGGINLLPFIMTLVTAIYAFVMAEISKKERLQTIVIGFFFLLLLYTAPSALLIFWTCNLLWSLLDSLLIQEMDWLGYYISENELAFLIIFALALMIGLFIPIEIYIKNSRQLWFNLKDIVKYFFIDTVRYIAILFIIYFVCWRKKVRLVYLSVLMGVFLGVFFQSYIIGLDYGSFDGHEIKWETYTAEGIANTIIWLFFLILPSLCYYRTRYNVVKFKKIVKPILFCFVLIQSVVLLIILIKNPIQKDIVYENGKAGILTTKNMFTVSSKDNIIIFLLDSFDATVFEEIQEKNPELLADLKDFSSYPDTTSSYGFTNYSLPEILTGKRYNPSTRWSNYLRQAWKETPYYNKLRENNYMINLYTSGDYVDKKAPVNNLVTESIKMDRNNAVNFNILVKFRIMPHYLKKIYYHYNPKNQYLAILNNAVEEYNENDREFFLKIKKGFELIDNKNVFQFYHLGGLHPPFTIDENVELINTNNDYNYSHSAEYAQAIGVLKIVKEYILKMKELGLYNNSTIGILADHGHHRAIGKRPIFLIKQPDETHSIFIEDKSVNHVANLMPLVFKRFKDTIDNPFSIDSDGRFFYFENANDGVFEKFFVKSPSRDIKSWIDLGPVQKNYNLDRKYRIGEVIDFSYFGNSYKYKDEGWADEELSFGSLIAKKEAKLVIELDTNKAIEKDLIIKLSGHPLLHLTGQLAHQLPYRNVYLFANDTVVGNWHFTNNKRVEVQCKIPGNKLDSNILVLRFLIENPADENVREKFQVNRIIIENVK